MVRFVMLRARPSGRTAVNATHLRLGAFAVRYLFLSLAASASPPPRGQDVPRLPAGDLGAETRALQKASRHSMASACKILASSGTRDRGWGVQGSVLAKD